MERLISCLGLLVMVGLAWLLSVNKRQIRARVIVGGLVLQLGLALLVLKTVPGRFVFTAMGDFFNAVLDSVDAGSSMVFGENFSEFYFAFKVLPTIIFFSSLMSVLYHLGIVQKLVMACAIVMQRTLRLSGAESLSVAANIFVGQTEAPLVIRPYLDDMTESELMAVMVGGFASISGAVLAAFVGMGIDAGHLVTASVISAPAALLIAKVIVPETETPKTTDSVQIQVERNSVNVIEAAATGASDGLKLALNIAAMLIAFLAMVALLDAGIGLLGAQLGYRGEEQWTLASILGYLFFPLAWVMGIESADCYRAGQLLGLKMAANEFVAYQEMATFMEDSSSELSPRSSKILTYALCGFANFSSIGVQIGGIGGIVPGRRRDLARLGLRAMLGGTLATCMTACVAGILI